LLKRPIDNGQIIRSKLPEFVSESPSQDADEVSNNTWWESDNSESCYVAEFLFDDTYEDNDEEEKDDEEEVKGGKE
jgi:hypothetical protein